MIEAGAFGTCMGKENHLPSGGPAIPLGGCARVVVLSVAPASLQPRLVCGVLPGVWSRFEMNMICFPSGDQRGLVSLKLPVVSGRWSVPSKLMIQRLEHRLSVIMSAN